MTALPPVPSVLDVRLIGSEASDAELGTHLCFKYTAAAPSVAELDTFCTAVATAWNSNLAVYTPSEYTLTRVDAADLTSATSSVGSATVSHAGTQSGQYLSLSTCFSLQYETTLRRRGGHWRGQWRFGTAAVLQTAQTWTSAFVGDVEAAFLTFVGAVEAAIWSGGGSLSHVAVQYYGPPNKVVTGSTGRVRTVSSLAGTAGADLTAPVVYPVIGYSAFNRLGSQRKRLGKSGT